MTAGSGCEERFEAVQPVPGHAFVPIPIRMDAGKEVRKLDKNCVVVDKRNIGLLRDPFNERVDLLLDSLCGFC